jgi:hypothetical protein
MNVNCARHLYYKNLKEIAKLADNVDKLTGYETRHSYACVAEEMGIPSSAISQMWSNER